MILPERIGGLFEYEHYYRVKFAIDGVPNPATICVREIPDAWRRLKDIDERAAVNGLFLKTGDVSGEHAELVFAAKRMLWLPDQPIEKVGVRKSHVWLADLGVDIGEFDNVKPTNRKKFGSQETEAFYQILAATRDVQQQGAREPLIEKMDLAAMLTQPEEQHGRCFRFRCSARRIQKVRIGEPELQKRFGIDHYYQIDAFVPLGDQTGSRQSDSPARP